MEIFFLLISFQGILQQKTPSATHTGSDSLSSNEVHYKISGLKYYILIVTCTCKHWYITHCLFQVQRSLQNDMLILVTQELPVNFMQVDLTVMQFTVSWLFCQASMGNRNFLCAKHSKRDVECNLFYRQLIKRCRYNVGGCLAQKMHKSGSVAKFPEVHPKLNSKCF